jgi:hypothetical protein
VLQVSASAISVSEISSTIELQRAIYITIDRGNENSDVLIWSKQELFSHWRASVTTVVANRRGDGSAHVAK